MPAPTLNYVSCPDPAGGHRMAYWTWGDPGAKHLTVCVHGLSRQGRDFDALAQSLVARSARPLRVVCPDVVGRGQSDWLRDPMGYQVPTYVADMLRLLQELNERGPIQALDWVGTSMGGLIAMAVCGTPGLPLPAPVRRLVLNDVGPVIEWQALQRIGLYLGQVAQFDTLQQAADAMWAVSRSFGPHTPEQWLALSQAMVRQQPEGGYTLHYDPAIAVPFRALTQADSQQGEALLWQLYDNIQAEILLLRGTESDLLSRATAAEMTRRARKARLVEFEGVGHAPTLVSDNQIEAVASFLLQQDSSFNEKPLSGTG